jgi:CYTH domain-containing protein
MSETVTKNEIERKWILRGVPPFSNPPDLSYTIHQFYADDGWRYRASVNNVTYETEYSKTKKTPNGHGSNLEIESPIEVSEYNEAMNGAKKSITKTRNIFLQNGLKWEVDEFISVKLVIMEVELDSIDQPIEIPGFLQDLIIYEVTGIKEFNNSNLSR